jgi:hypothetical protein
VEVAPKAGVGDGLGVGIGASSGATAVSGKSSEVSDITMKTRADPKISKYAVRSTILRGGIGAPPSTGASRPSNLYVTIPMAMRPRTARSKIQGTG